MAHSPRAPDRLPLRTALFLTEDCYLAHAIGWICRLDQDGDLLIAPLDPNPAIAVPTDPNAFRWVDIDDLPPLRAWQARRIRQILLDRRDP